MSTSPHEPKPRRRAIASLPSTTTPSNIAETVHDLILKIGKEGECDWSTLAVMVRKAEHNGSGLPDLLSVSAELRWPECSGCTQYSESGIHWDTCQYRPEVCQPVHAAEMSKQ
ncbi:hypothetical protein [Kribbella deserti]|uniref:Uncharacterized protein n=1 Tax=Kribbella deserti TaxID=1926257 RepID=A0ABV6QPR3_9ACTN